MRVPYAPLHQTRERLAPTRGVYHAHLARLALFVFTDKTHAVRLYERLGFAIEGTMPRMGFGAGGWMDAYLMGRLHDP